MVDSHAFPRRGWVYWVDFGVPVEQEQGWRRPALVIQNDIGNEYSSTTIVASITASGPTDDYPFIVRLPDGLLPKSSLVQCDQLRTISVERIELSKPLARAPDEIMVQVELALRRQLGFPAE